jgi:cytochrome c553
MQWIRNGKPNSLMPAFDLKQGGILDEDQMASLADHLDSAAFKTGRSATPAKTPQP